MSYAAGLIPAVSGRTAIGAVYAFLRPALRQGTVAQPYRGPAVAREGSYVYTNRSEGTLDAFTGLEGTRSQALFPHPVAVQRQLPPDLAIVDFTP